MLKTLNSVLLTSLLSMGAHASTFVGNGGNSGDVELQVTLKEIQETLRLIDNGKNSNEFKLCTCYPQLKGHPMCNTLSKLNSQQVQFCEKYIKDNSENLRKAANQLSQNGIEWTHEKIEVVENQSLRAADAVTDANTNKITLNKDQFINMPNYERVFLLSHELGHLQRWENKYIVDRQAIGPFDGPEGGREFLNSISAALTMEALDTQVIHQFQADLKRSQGYKKHWFELGTASTNTKEVLFGVNEKSGHFLSYRFQFSDQWGVQGEYRSSKGNKSYLSSTKSEETLTGYGVGISYRFFPFKDPLTFWGQSHFVISLNADKINGEFSLSDSFLKTETNSSSTSWMGSLNYYMPLQNNFWIFIKAAVSGHHISYSIPNITIQNDFNSNFNLGASYGF
ncbi:MAG TPA: hypothetical protein PLJ21_13115 [Pseudobdellovibrionaceae bacterium]|nr:hypothetical protein [Pseudobdellovibrionaceae bacterium]